MIVGKGMGDIQDTISSMRDWSASDWAITLGVGYVLYSLLFTTQHHYGVVSSKVGSVKGRYKKRRALEQQLEDY